MSVYMTEDEQLEAIKKWWKTYSNVIILILSLVLLTMTGFKYWYWHENKVTIQASSAYEHLMFSFANHDNKSVRAYAKQLTQHYNQTVYADAARMILAKLFVTHAQYAKAREVLSEVASHSKILALRQVATLRIARLFAEENAYDKALEQLKPIENTIYKPVVNELKGDIYARSGKQQEAIIAYKKAVRQVPNGMGNLFLEMKANELGAVQK